MEKKVIDFVTIDGEYYGGDQNWHTHKMMKLGGCSAVSACEVCMYLAKIYPALRELYPFDPACVTRQDFLRFFEIMFKYLHPGIGGLTSIEKYVRMLGKYVETTGVDVTIEKMAGCAEYANAERFVTSAIDQSVPVMYLMLKHGEVAFDEYEWHWFTLTGYARVHDGVDVDFATWGQKHTFNLKKAWDTKKAWRGGMVKILYR